MNIGQIVQARVDQVEQYGVFASNDEGRLFIQIPELDWVRRIPDAKQFASVGDEFEILVLGFNENRNQFLGSIKQAHPELDPFRDKHLYEVGTTHQSKVVLNTAYGTFVEIAPGVQGLIRKQNDNELATGTQLTVHVTFFDIERLLIEVAITK